MKKFFFILMTMIAFISFVFIIDSCKKDDEQNNTLVTKLDTIKPVITLKGSSTMAIVFGSTWSDPGYTATDNKDGDLTTKVMIDGSVKNDSASTVILTYSVTDSSTNTGTATRIVTVDAASFLEGNYEVVDVSDGITSLYNDNVLASTTTKNRINVNKFAFYANANVYFNLNGTNVSLPNQVVHCGTPPNDVDHTFEGNGTFTNGKKIVITFSDRFTLNGNNYYYLGCTETYTAQ